METGMVETIGQKIKRLRLEKGMTQGEVADGFVTISMISQLERDRNTASVELLQHLARKLQVPLHELVEDEVEQMEKACLQKLVKVYLETKQPTEAEPLLVKLRGRSDLSQAETIELTVEMGECLYQQSRYDEALGELLPLAEELEAVNYDDAHVLALVRYTVGNVYNQMQNFSNANYNYRKAFDYTNRFPTINALTAKIAYNVGLTLRKVGLAHQAMPYLRTSHDYFRQTGELSKLAITIYEQGITYKEAHDFQHAVECFDHAKIIFHSLNLKNYSFIVQRTIASTVTAIEDPELAIKQLEDCIEPFEEEMNYSNLILVYSRIASVHLKSDRFDEAHDALQKAMSLVEIHGYQNSPESADCLQTLANCLHKQEKYDEAIPCSLKSANIFGTIGLISEQIDSLQIAVDSYQGLEEYKRALELERECNNLFRQLHNKER
ncbi:transcriptional regulator with XRE-family HTH domain [Tumebacillus sp. BK434]|uniref:helix-turn-helix transcriptional regulator n=1 Tax=Tumebacillus sp. BK434 TaxID=2512169 RepID=UPI0010DF65FE|nr:helix-turn-helix transcriptional regulator [Tumebacillus sp. BK434]TCP58190.1 transcriptional regulator with XRE-family HTH domain [Tumebacillus sp. BK434]